jgi:tRNA1(Val) A37 N6-methylase TrmN6
MLSNLSSRAIDSAIQSLRTAHVNDRQEIGRLIVLLADELKQAPERADPASTLDLYRCLMCMTVLGYLHLCVRKPGEGRVRSIDVFPELPGLRLVEGVFSPEFATDSYLWAKHLAAARGVANKLVLEMGAGSGLISLYLSLEGDAGPVTVVDINPAAIENLHLNRAHFRLESERFTVVESDLFERIPEEARFDIVLWAMPWVYLDSPASIELVERTRDPEMRRLLYSVVDIRLESVLRFISQAKSRLQPDGSVLLITSDFCRNDLIEAHARRENLSYSLEQFAQAENVVPCMGIVLNLYQIRLKML